MWMRRVGLPPLWPSRLKVSLMCVLQAGFIYSFAQYLYQADVDYLNLGRPSTDEVHCYLTEELCQEDDDPLACMMSRHELPFGGVFVGKATDRGCPVQYTDTCSSFSLPLKSLHGDLGRLHTTNRSINPLRMWTLLFAMLSSFFVLAVAIHDHALITARCRPSILSLRALQRERPLWWGCAAGVQLTGPMAMLRERHCRIWGVLLPFWWVYRVLVFVIVVYPITFLSAHASPIEFSRIMVFTTGLLCMFCSVAFTFSVIFLERDLYAIFWNARQLSRGCVCYCEYPLAGSVVFRLVFLGIVVFVGSFSISFRALKGLRRANWGNLFSVLYAVPVEVFPVCWQRPREAGGGPIMFRKEGEEVQGEPAFDPFCLMDEQTESGRSRVHLRPEPQGEEQRERWHRVVQEPEIGCCGIPLPVSRKVADMAELDAVRVGECPLEEVVEMQK